MVRHSACRWTLAALALGWGGNATADAISSTGVDPGSSIFPAFATGNVQADMPASSSVTIVPGQAGRGSVVIRRRRSSVRSTARPAAGTTARPTVSPMPW